MAKDKCPHCNRLNCIPGVAKTNCENHGGGTFNVPCLHCGRMIEISLARRVEVMSIEKSDVPLDEQDFSVAHLENLGK